MIPGWKSISARKTRMPEASNQMERVLQHAIISQAQTITIAAIGVREPVASSASPISIAAIEVSQLRRGLNVMLNASQSAQKKPYRCELRSGLSSAPLPIRRLPGLPSKINIVKL